jgi:hypothetical protein
MKHTKWLEKQMQKNLHDVTSQIFKTRKKIKFPFPKIGANKNFYSIEFGA